jgi:hypothetical protein
MASSEKRKPKSTRDPIRDPADSVTEEQLLKLQQASGNTAPAYLTGTSFKTPQQQSETTDSSMSPFTSIPAHLDSDNVFAFYPSSGNPTEADRPTLVDAVLEQLRQARMRRQRPH